MRLVHLGAQVWQGRTAPTERLFRPVRNNGTDYPTGGLWTSSFQRHGAGSAWLDWQEAEGGDAMTSGWTWLMDVDPGANVLYLEDTVDVLALHNSGYTDRDAGLAAMGRPTLDWRALARDFHAVHLVRPVNDRLLGWPCEMTLWFDLRVCNARRLVAA